MTNHNHNMSTDNLPDTTENQAPLEKKPYHRREFIKATETLEKVVESAEWQKENLRSGFHDASTASQPAGPDKDRRIRIESLHKPAAMLFRAATDVTNPRQDTDRKTLVDILSRLNNLIDKTWELDRTRNLDNKQEIAEKLLDIAEEVDEYLTTHENHAQQN